jgi:hypothetical protein
MIERPSIIITSLGRTGTTFFYSLFEDIIPNSSAFHEPDIVQHFGTKDRFGAFYKRVKDAGVHNMVLKKILGKWSLIRLSDARLRGELNYENATQEVLRQRADFVNSKPGAVYVESNAGYYGLLDVLKGVYTHHKAIFLIRDARAWVSSAIKVDELYGRRGWRDVFAHQMPTAAQFPGDPYAGDWQNTSRFVKLCWAWTKLNEYALNAALENPNARIFQFEQIFSGKEKYQYLNDLVAFATSLPGLANAQIGSTKGWLEKKINQSAQDAHDWDKWTKDEKRQMETICGPLMEKAGYKF